MTPSEAPSTGRPPTTDGTPAVDARQGVISGRVLTVLMASVVLTVVALVMAYLVFGH